MVFGDGKGSISPTASPTRRDYILAKSVNVQPHNMEKSKYRHKGGREISGKVGSPTHHHSSQSSLSHKGVTTPPGGCPAHLPSPYGVSARSNDFIHKAGDFNNPVDLDPRYRCNKDRRRKHRHSKSPSSPPGGATERSHSPGALSAGSRSADSRNQSFKKAISNKGSAGVPLADEEDLSPVSPDTPIRDQIGFAPRTTSAPGKGAEIIPMGDYNRRNRNRFRDSGIADTHIGSPDSNPKQTLLPGTTTEPRPPVEGRDSVRRKEPYTTITTPDRQNGNFLSGQGDKPGLKPLPLRNVQRPDGQSPEHQTEDPNANPRTPDSGGLSPILRKTQLFDNESKDSSAVHTPDNQDEYEYDDYMPTLPGSYFTMDPHAYTLTWSQQQPWNPAHKQPPPNNDPSVNESNA